MFRAWVAFFLVCGAFLGSNAAERKLRVLSTFLPAYCIAANVAGEHAAVENLLPGSVSLHDYQLSPPDLQKIATADVIVVNGLGLETFLEKAFKSTGTKAKLVTLTHGFDPDLIAEDAVGHRHSEPGHDHTHDPHTWLDPILAARSVTNVLQALQQADPKNAAAFATNAAAYTRRLNQLHEDFKDQFASIQSTPFITYHNAFRYFVRRYGLNLVGVVEQVPEVAPSVRERSDLLKTIRAKNVKVLFTEPGASPRLAQQIAKDSKLRLEQLDPLETGQLSPDAYEKGMRRNAETLVRGLR